MSNKKDMLSTSVRKAHEAIAVTPKSGKLTLLSRKLYNSLLIAAQEQGEDRNVYRIPLKQIVANAQFDSKDTRLLKDHLLRMMETKVEWNSIGEDESRRWGVSVLLAEAYFVEDKKGGSVFVEWSYPAKFKKQLLDPSLYARISLKWMNKLRSGQAFALYEICARYADSPAHLTMRESLDWWRPVLTGSPPDSLESSAYAEFKTFNRAVIKPAVAEINSLTDLTVEPILHKEGRRVTHLQFRVVKKVQESLALGEAPLFDMSLLSQMMALGASQAEAEQLYVETEEGTLRAGLKEVESRKGNKKLTPLTSPWAYFKSRIKSGTLKAVQSASAQLPGKPRESREQLLSRYADHRRNEARAMYGEMPDEQKEDWLEKFRVSLKVSGQTLVLGELEKKGLARSKMAETGFFTWLADQTWGEPGEGDLLDFVLNQP